MKTIESNVGERFRKETAHHEMEICHVSGVHRHLTFRQPGTFAYGFHITTWPGYLCISGDMGSYVFSRLDDMFEFFRGESINTSYWSEKLTAHDKSSGHREFSAEFYRAALESDFAEWEFKNDDDRTRAWAAITDEWDGILEVHSVQEAVTKAHEWECAVSKRGFDYFYEHTLEDYTFQFVWCCYAIQWAIARFDETTSVPQEAA